MNSKVTLSSCYREVKNRTSQTLMSQWLVCTAIVWNLYIFTTADHLEHDKRAAVRLVHHDYRRTTSASNLVDILGWENINTMVFGFSNRYLVKFTIHWLIFTCHRLSYQQPYWQSWPSAEISYSRSHYAHISFIPLTRSVRLRNQLPSKVGFAGSPATFLLGSILTIIGWS